jgi:hypothetical protein
LVQYCRLADGEAELDSLMRRAIWRAVARRFGNRVRIGSGVCFKHLETFEIGDGVFIGDQAYIQGRFDEVTKIGNYVWIGPQSYFDARNLILEDDVGCGPGAKVLGSSHTGFPIDRPIIKTDLKIRPGACRGLGGYWNGCNYPARHHCRQGEHRWCRRGSNARRPSLFHSGWHSRPLSSLAGWICTQQRKQMNCTPASTTLCAEIEISLVGDVLTSEA